MFYSLKGHFDPKKSRLSLPCAIDGRSHERSLPRETFLIFCLTGAYFTGGRKWPQNTVLVVINQYFSVTSPLMGDPAADNGGIPGFPFSAFRIPLSEFHCFPGPRLSNLVKTFLNNFRQPFQRINTG
jgi:hypothetical protein